MPYGREHSTVPTEVPVAMPRIPGPWGEPPHVDDVKPMTTTGTAIHLTGAVINSLSSAGAVVYLLRHAGVNKGGWPATVAGAATGSYAGDLASGLLHWSFDTWFDEGVDPLRRMVYVVREHHMRPARIFRYRLRDEAGMLSWFAFAVSAPLYATARLPGRSRRPGTQSCSELS